MVRCSRFLHLERLIKVTLAFREWRITGGLNSSQKNKLFVCALFIAELGGYKAIRLYKLIFSCNCQDVTFTCYLKESRGEGNTIRWMMEFTIVYSLH
jgi:hypothetical protein